MAGKPERLQTEAAYIFAGPISRIDGFPGKAQLWGRTAVALWPIYQPRLITFGLSRKRNK